MIVLAGADIVLPDRVLPSGSVVIVENRIQAIEPRIIDAAAGAVVIDVAGALVVPGFIDVHVHGLEGTDVLDGAGAIAAVAARLPRHGVTAFCPTSIACPPASLEIMLRDTALARGTLAPDSARVLPAHLESNFINPEFKGAQPEECLRTPRSPRRSSDPGDFSGSDVLATIAAHRHTVGIVTLAPEIDGGLELVRDLSAAGHRVSIGHTGASYEEALEAIEAGARHATHLFNRMTPLNHRAPGAAGAVLHSEDVAAELVCDGFHVHPAIMKMAIRAKGVARVMAITDGTAGSGLPVGTRTHIGGRPIIVTEKTAELEDGTIAGSVLSMDGAFRALLNKVGLSLVDAARACSTTPAEELRLGDLGRIAPGAIADLAVLDRETLSVRYTVINGHIWRNRAGPAHV
jgi:N-acetylglucosamine-6-phosphate deacetylase